VNVRSGRRARLFAIPAALLIAGAAFVAVPGGAIAVGPCDMKVATKRTSTQTYPSGVELNTYEVKVTYGTRTQSAVVQRMVMPTGTKPVLVHKRLGWTGTLRDQISDQARKGVAAINGDFFYEYSTGQDRVILPRGPSVSGGVVVRGDDEDMRVLGVDTKGRPYAGMFRVAGTVTRASDAFTVSGLNWHWLGSKGVVVYTNDWADGSAARRPLAAVEWVVDRGRITEVRTGNARGKDVALGTKVVAFGSDHAAAARRAHVRDAVSVAVTQVTSTGVALKEAVGRGAALVRDGAIAFTCAEYTNELRPRTTAGWLGSGRWATLIVPGTGYDSHGYRVGGLGLPQEANVLKALGFVSADEVDGGGSVTSYVRRGDNRWDRVDDSDSRWARPIPNGLAFIPN
jgi:hypothetical protein